MQAAKYLGVDPQRLIELPAFWKDKAIIAMTAEAEASEILQERQRNQQPH